MRLVILLVGVVLLAVGCGYNPEKPVYDTQRNPEQFPPRAIALIIGVQDSSLATYNQITGAFGELYEKEPSLLDNARWRKVIDRLGARFRYRADKLAQQGVAHYAEAANMYTLAAFAKPDDSRLQHTRAAFETWTAAVQAGVVPSIPKSDSAALSLPEQIRLLRYFLLADSVHRAFGKEYLRPQILDTRAAEKALEPTSTVLSTADKCFLATLGFPYKSPDSAVAHFGEPPIDLIAARLEAYPNHWYGAELYFVPRDTVPADLSVAFRVHAPDSVSSATDAGWIPFDFRPDPASATWKPGVVASAYRRFVVPRPIDQVSVGVFEKVADSAHFIRLRDTGEPMVVLPPTALADR